MNEVHEDEPAMKSHGEKVKEGHTERRKRLSARIRRLIEAGGYGQEEEPEADLPPVAMAAQQPIAPATHAEE